MLPTTSSRPGADFHTPIAWDSMGYIIPTTMPMLFWDRVVVKAFKTSVSVDLVEIINLWTVLVRSYVSPFRMNLNGSACCRKSSVWFIASATSKLLAEIQVVDLARTMNRTCRNSVRNHCINSWISAISRTWMNLVCWMLKWPGRCYASFETKSPPQRAAISETG